MCVNPKDILKSYTAVGIYEEWDVSMKLFDAKVPSSVRKWDADTMLNRGAQSSARNALLQWAYTSPDINIALATDLILYDFALSLFNYQVKNTLGVAESVPLKRSGL